MAARAADYARMSSAEASVFYTDLKMKGSSKPREKKRNSAVKKDGRKFGDEWGKAGGSPKTSGRRILLLNGPRTEQKAKAVLIPVSPE
jgi:hypothetical protein